MADSNLLAGPLGAPPGPRDREDTAPVVPIGALAWDRSGNQYKYVKNGEASAAFVVNELVRLREAALVQGDYVKSVTGDAGQAGPYGIALKAVAAASYGWILVEGVGSLKFDKSGNDNSNADEGDGLAASDGTGGQCSVARTASNQTQDVVIAVALSTSDGDGTLTVFLRP